LVVNPFLLVVIVTVFKHGRSLPTGRAEILQRLVCGMLGQWQGTAYRKPDRFWYVHKHVLLSNVAHAIVEEGLALSPRRIVELFAEAYRENQRTLGGSALNPIGSRA
jgi:hypothetical protein